MRDFIVDFLSNINTVLISIIHKRILKFHPFDYFSPGSCCFTGFVMIFFEIY